MATFVMYGTYTTHALQQISKERTRKVTDVIERLGGTLQQMVATLGEHDLVMVVTLPALEDAIKVSVALRKLTGIAFSTAPAVNIETFDQLMSTI